MVYVNGSAAHENTVGASGCNNCCDPCGLDPGRRDWSHTDYNAMATVGGGIGLYLRRDLRLDFTYDHGFRSDINASMGPVGSTTFGMTHDLLLANLYFDFDVGTRAIVPYFGVGIGMARNTLSAGTASLLGLDNSCQSGCPQYVSFNETYGEHSTWNLAGALTAGLTMQLTPRVALDTNYRFVYLGSAKTGELKYGPTTASSGIMIDDITAHEFRVGLRYDIR
jgi:opacity protein-like surface antigen